MFNQQFSKDPHLSRRVKPWWSDYENTAFSQRIANHRRYQGAGCELFLRQKIRQRGYAEPGDGRRRKSRSVVRFESALRMHGDRLVSVNEVPRLGTSHETLMRDELLRRFGSAVLPDICGARDELSMHRPDPPYDQVRSR